MSKVRLKIYPVSDVHGFVPFNQEDFPIQLRTLKADEMLAHHQLRALMFTYMARVLRYLKEGSPPVQCLEDLEHYFRISYIDSPSNNGEAYFVHVKTGEMRKFKFVIKQTTYRNRDRAINRMINHLVLDLHIPFLPLVYDTFLCPHSRCAFHSEEKTKSLEKDQEACSLFLMEYFNGGSIKRLWRQLMAGLVPPTSDTITCFRVLVTQSLLALFSLHQKLFSTHGDCHSENIMLHYFHHKDSLQVIPHQYVQYTLELTNENPLHHVYPTETISFFLPVMNVQAFLIDFDFVLSKSYGIVPGNPNLHAFQYDYYRYWVSFIRDIQKYHTAADKIENLRLESHKESPMVATKAISPDLYIPVKTQRWIEKELQPDNFDSFLPPEPSRKERAEKKGIYDYHAEFQYKNVAWSGRFVTEFVRQVLPKAFEDPAAYDPQAEVVDMFQYRLQDKLKFQSQLPGAKQP